MLIDRLITEGVYDPAIFKAVFVVGGTGSGKSYIVRKTTLGHGLKVVNSDAAFEKLLHQHNLSLKMPDSERDERDRLYLRGKDITRNIMDTYIQNRLGLVIDGTGKDYDSLKKKKDLLDSLGYDTFMVFVNTSLEVSLHRNRTRERSLPDKLVTKNWELSNGNIGKYQELMGTKNFVIIDNNGDGVDVTGRVWKEIMKFVKEPVKNYRAKEWMQAQLVGKNRLGVQRETN